MKMKPQRHFWIVVACCGLAAASLGICINADGVFYTPVSAAFNTGRGNVSLYATFSGIAMGIFSPIAVKLLEKVKLAIIASAGVILTAGATLMMAFATELWQLYLFGTLRGTGCSAFSIAILTMIIGNWFFKWQATMTGIVMSFTGLAGAVFSPVFTAVIERSGYQAAYMVGAGAILLLALPGTLFILTLLPSEANTYPYGLSIAMDKPAETPAAKLIAEKEAAAGPDSGKTVSGRMSVNDDETQNMKLVFGSLIFVVIVTISVISVMVTAISQHLPGFSESIGNQPQTGAVMLSLVMIGNVSFKFLMGYLCDRIGVYRALFLMIGINISSMAIFLSKPQNALILLAASFLFGSIYSISNVGVSTLVRKIYGNQQYGKAFGFVTIFSSISPALSIALIGMLYDLTRSYYIAFWGAVTIGLCCAVLLMILKLSIRRQTLRNAG